MLPPGEYKRSRSWVDLPKRFRLLLNYFGPFCFYTKSGQHLLLTAVVRAAIVAAAVYTGVAAYDIIPG